VEKKYTYEDFLEIIKTLRSENGCPWDREQTHESLKPCVMEEAAELAAAIRIYDKTKNPENMIEELGDLLLQVVMHSEIGSEEGIFTMDDVIQCVSEKMVRRHPHVFGEVQADNAEQVLSNWEDIKKTEKEGKAWIESPLREIPLELPALTRAAKVLKKQDKLYQNVPDCNEAMKELKANILEMESLLKEDGASKERLEKCFGRALLNMSNIAMKSKIAGEQVLIDEIEEIIEKYEPKNGKLP